MERRLKNITKFVLIGILLTIVYFMYHHYQDNSNNFSIKAETSSTKTAEPENLLLPTEWLPTYEYVSNHTTSAPINTRIREGSYLTTEVVKIHDWGKANLVDNGVYLINNQKNWTISNSVITYFVNPTIGVSQKVSLSVGRYYQYSFDLRLNLQWYSTENIYYTVLSDHIKNWSFRQNKNVWYNQKKNFVAQTNSEEIFLYAKPADADFSTSEFKNVQLTDITEDVLSVLDQVNKLFTDETRSRIKLSTTQKKIDLTKNKVDGYADLLSATDKSKATTRLTEAQKLLNDIKMSLSAEDLEDNQMNPASDTINGKTAPNAFLQFTSDVRSFAEGKLISEVEDDQQKYQIRADQTGNFQYKLPAGTYFQARESVTITSMLNGKTSLVKMVVKDTTPPLQPTLNILKDTSSIFSGTAEIKSTINVYDDSDKKVITSGQAGSNGNYALNIPETSQPLKPYKKYYVTATDEAGNISERSTIQTVADTLPPTAKPVRQVLTLGDSLPELTKLLTTIYDNAGAENVSLQLTKSPDLSKIGYTSAEITLTDAAKNQTVVVVSVLVKEAQTVLDENNLLDARDFTIQTVYYPETEEAQRKFLIEQSQLSAWDIVNGKNMNEQVRIDKLNLMKKPGSYKITFQVGNIKKEITVNLTVGDLIFDKITSDMSFGTATIRSKKQTIRPENNIKISITDTRFVSNDWRLVTQLEYPLQTTDGHKMDGGIIFQRRDENGQWVKKRINDLSTTKVYSNTEKVPGKTTIEFLDDKEIVLSVLPGNNYSDKPYSTKIIWTLENGP